MLPHAILLALLVCLRTGSAVPKCQFDKDQHYKDLVGGLRLNMEDSLFTAAGKTVESSFINIPRPINDDTFKGGICFGDHMKTILPDYGTPKMVGAVCPVLSAPDSNTDIAWCKAKKLNAKAQIKLNRISFNNCKMDRSKTESETKTKKYEIHGDLKVSGTLFKAIGIEASIGGALETTRTYQLTTTESCKAGQSATFVSVGIIVTTTVGEVSVSGRDERANCVEDKYTTTTPFTNTYLVAEDTAWLDCNAADAPATGTSKRDLEDYPDEDICYSLDPSRYMEPEPCFA